MKAHEITAVGKRATWRARHRSLVLVLTACSLAVPSMASAIDRFERTPTELGQTTGAFRESLSFGQIDGRDSTAGRSGDASQSVGTAPGASAEQVRIRDGSAAVPFVPWPNGAPPTKADGGFEWTSAAIGAGAAMGLVALGAAVFVMLRRRTAMSPSASTS